MEWRNQPVVLLDAASCVESGGWAVPPLAVESRPADRLCSWINGFKHSVRFPSNPDSLQNAIVA